MVDVMVLVHGDAGDGVVDVAVDEGVLAVVGVAIGVVELALMVDVVNAIAVFVVSEPGGLDAVQPN